MLIFKGVRIVEVKEGTENRKILGYTTSNKEILKNAIKKFNITIISINDVQEKPTGNLYEFGLTEDGENFNIIISIEGKIRQAFKNFLDQFGIKSISYVKPYGSQIEDEKQKIILQKLFDEYNKDSDEKVIKDKEIDIHRISESDKKKVENFKKEINDFIEEMNDFIPKANTVDPTLTIELKKEIGNLIKYKSTTNIFKLADHYKKALEISEKLYKEYYNKEKTKENESENEYLISEMDVVAELEKFKKVQRTKSLEKVDSKEFGTGWHKKTIYDIFGKYGINIKLLTKEFQTKYKLNYFGFGEIFKFIQFILIFLIINYSILLMYKLLTDKENVSSILSIYYMLFNIANWGIIITIGKMINKKMSIFISIIAMIILYIGLYFIKNYFGL